MAKQKSVRPDMKGRITLGKLAEGVSSFRIIQQADGRILLEPYVEIALKEMRPINTANGVQEDISGHIGAGYEQIAANPITPTVQESKTLDRIQAAKSVMMGRGGL